ncbi:unnamed protein product, partial [Ilex paraguariensis]
VVVTVATEDVVNAEVSSSAPTREPSTLATNMEAPIAVPSSAPLAPQTNAPVVVVSPPNDADD